MLNKIFLILVGLAILITGFFTFYSYSWLQSVGNPELTIENFNYFSNIAWSVLWLSLIVLLVFANILIWNGGKTWSLWIAFSIFAIFVLLQTIWLAPAFQAFKQTETNSESSFTFTPIVGVLTVFIVAVIVFCNQFLVLRLKEKMFGEKPEEIEVEQ